MANKKGRVEKIIFIDSPVADYVDMMFNGHELAISSNLPIEKQIEYISKVLMHEGTMGIQLMPATNVTATTDAAH